MSVGDVIQVYELGKEVAVGGGCNAINDWRLCHDTAGCYAKSMYGNFQGCFNDDGSIDAQAEMSVGDLMKVNELGEKRVAENTGERIVPVPISFNAEAEVGGWRTCGSCQRGYFCHPTAIECRPNDRCTVTLYSSRTYGGRKTVLSGFGTSTMRNGAGKAQSLKLDDGCCVSLYKGSNYSGDTIEYCRDTLFIDGRYSNKIRSLQVYRR